MVQQWLHQRGEAAVIASHVLFWKDLDLACWKMSCTLLVLLDGISKLQ
jgi:hypothetical protein